MKYKFIHSPTASVNAKIDPISSSFNQFNIEGYASVFGVQDNDNEIIEKDTFTKLNDFSHKTFKLLWQHDVTCPIGLIKSIEQDNFGLFIKASITSSTDKARESISLIKDKILDSFSIGFIPVKSTKLDNNRVSITEAILYEISLVTFPSNPMSKITNIVGN